ncbi:PqqD family protein [Robinsoniella peoriensis]
MGKKNKKNYLDFVPICNPKFEWDLDKKGNVVVHMENKGFYNWIAQKVFKKPRFSHITLDNYGSFAWQLMDGKKTVFQIANEMKEQFGDKADPLYERMTRFFQTLYQNNFIGYVSEKKKKK